MKTLKIGGAVIGLLIAVFFLIGVFFPDFEYENSVEVDASQQKCWDVFHDASGMGEWMPGFESLTLKSGNVLEKGSVYEFVVTSDDERMVMEETITEIHPTESVTYKLTNDVLTSDYTFTFEPLSNEHTLIRARYKVTGNNLLWRSILFMSKSMIKGSGQEQIEGLKKIAEKKH